MRDGDVNEVVVGRFGDRREIAGQGRPVVCDLNTEIVRVRLRSVEALVFLADDDRQQLTQRSRKLRVAEHRRGVQAH